MRLVKRSSNGDLELELFADSSIPPYAILSHTWGTESEEVTFDDMIRGRGRDKAGFMKIKFCGEQAARDGLHYFWVDTCCINKEIYAELQEAISSMFRWYQSAVKCYALLSDVPTKDSRATWKRTFRQSKWFTRCWTLQELLAPICVEFFSADRDRLGDKGSLEQQIYEATAIPKLALQGGPLSEFSIEDRLRWIQSRRAKHDEDLAYSLMGIFDVSISLRYGEGKVAALQRLQQEIEKFLDCCRDLRLIDPVDHKEEIEHRKGGLLEGSYKWIINNPDYQTWHNSDHSPLLWIKGDPGKGKTMLLCGIINEIKKSMANTELLSFFFCVGTDARINTATAVLRGLMYMLIRQRPSLVSHIRKKYDYAGKGLFSDANSWFAISDIFANMLQDQNLHTVYLIIDALDECADLSTLLEFIATKSSTSSRVKWIMSSRNLPTIERHLKTATHKRRLCLELNESSISAAVTIYIQSKVNDLAQRNSYTGDAKDIVEHYLLLNAHNTFLWAALVCEELSKAQGWKVQQKLTAFPPSLDAIYRRMMDQIKNSEDAELCLRVLAIVSTVYRPLTMDELEAIVDLPHGVSGDYEALSNLIGLCGSFLTLRERTILLVHQSARDFLVEKACHEIYPAQREKVHYAIFSRSLDEMRKVLKRDIYNIGAPGYPIDKVKTPVPDPLSSARYSCIYWIRHLSDCQSINGIAQEFKEGGSIYNFLRYYYLYWLEALSLCRYISEGAVLVGNMYTLAQAHTGNDIAVVELIRDAWRFIMAHKYPIQISPLQTYHSALIFSPTTSLIRRLFQFEEPTWINLKPVVGTDWSSCLQTLESRDGMIKCVAFSHDSTRIASGSGSRTIQIWDTNSGECLKTLNGHKNPIKSISFSHDSSQLASASRDAVKTWDPVDGKCVHTFEGTNKFINSAIYSHDSSWIVSVLHQDIKIWDAKCGTCLQTIETGHYNDSAVFSHDSTQLLSVPREYGIKIWDVERAECIQTLIGHTTRIYTAVFSHDSAQIASASYDATIKLWNATSGKCIRTLTTDSYPFMVIFSHDSTRLAFASRSGTVEICNAASGNRLQMFVEDPSYGISVAFSHDSTRLASASRDGTIKIWDTQGKGSHQSPDDHSRSVSSIAITYDSRRLASGDEDGSVKIWGTEEGASLRTLKTPDTISSLAFLYNPLRLMSVSGKTIQIWDSDSGSCLKILDGHWETVFESILSHDLTRLATSSFDRSVILWDTHTGDRVETLDDDDAASIAFSPDSTLLSKYSLDGLWIWDAQSGDLLDKYEYLGEEDSPTVMTFSHDSMRLAAGLSDNTLQIWNLDGELLHVLEGHSDYIVSVAFSHDSSRIASASQDGELNIWDANSYDCLKTIVVGQPLENIYFDATDSYLHTDVGLIALGDLQNPTSPSEGLEAESPKFHNLTIGLKGDWMMCNLENVLWLPSEYRSSCLAMSEDLIGVGGGTGKVWMCNRKIPQRLARLVSTRERSNFHI